MKNKQQMSNSYVRAGFLLVFSLLCSLLLWVYVTDSEGEEKSRPFPGVLVTFEGESTMRESRGLIVSDVSATSARVTLTGSRRTIASLESADLSVVVDLTKIDHTGNYQVTPRVDYPTRIDSSSISAVETNPETIHFYVDILDRKTIPVEGIFSGSAAAGFVAEPLEFNPGAVTIYGPEQVLEQVDHASVEVTRTEVDRTLTFDTTFVLIDNDGNRYENDEITFNTDTVSVTLPISAVKDIALVVDLLAGGGATEANVKWKLDPDTITLTGDSETLAGVNNISVARIDLAQIADDTYTDTFRIVIPNDTEITSGARETTLRLEIGGLTRRTVRIDKSRITCTNISEGYAWEIMNDSLDNVVLRGPAEAVNAVSEQNVRAVANLTDYGAATGFIQVPVRIEVDGSTEVGAVDLGYMVYVNITEASGEPTGETEG